MKSSYLKMAVVSFLVSGVLAGNTWAKETNKSATSSSSTKSATSSKSNVSSKPAASKSAESSKSKPVQKEYTGTVEVTKDKAGDIKAITLKVDSLVKSKYTITLDEKGQELGKIAGKKVTITATEEKKKDAKWLTVTKYSEVTSKPKTAKATSAAKPATPTAKPATPKTKPAASADSTKK